jgi:hypothetical protein
LTGRPSTTALALSLSLSACTAVRTIGEQPDAQALDAQDDAPELAACGTCGAPDATHLCVVGTVRDFVGAEPVGGVRVRVWDAVAFATDPSGAATLATLTTDPEGCFFADGLPQPASNLVVLVVDDADASGTHVPLGRDVASGGLAAPVPLTAWALRAATVDAWQSQIGGAPASCGGLRACGATLLLYLDPQGQPRAGVQPTGGDVFCFRGDRATLTAATTTDATGLCAVAPAATAGSFWYREVLP